LAGASASFADRRGLRKTTNPMLAMINNPPTNVCGGIVSPIVTAPMTTASNGVTREIIIARVDSILLNSK
jgi:hypothetical protein